MSSLQLREAKASLSEVVDAAERGEPTTITRHGKPVAVIAQLRRAGGVERADRLEQWLGDIIERFDYRILAMDVQVARETGAMSEAATAAGRHPGLADIVIAATARVHGLTVLTRSLKHFTPLGLSCLDPFKTD